MSKKYIGKYNELETEFFSTGVNLLMNLDTKKYTLDFDNDGKYTLYTKKP